MRRLAAGSGLALLLLPSVAPAVDPGADVKVSELLATTRTWNGGPIVYPAGTPELAALVVEIAPGGETGWHEHPVPSIGVVLEGTMEVVLTDGTTRRLTGGDALAESIDVVHKGRNVGAGPVRLLVFYAGAAGVPRSIPRPAAAAK